MTVRERSHEGLAIGVIGAGRLGSVVARLARETGHRTLVAASGAPSRLRLVTQYAAPGAEAMTAAEVAAGADVVVLALPFGEIATLPADALAGKVVIDATNHWWEADGELPSWADPARPTSESVQRMLPGARVVKALSHLSYRDLADGGRPPRHSTRQAIAVAGDDPDAVALVACLVDDFGFDPLVLDSLSATRALEPGHVAFGAAFDAHSLRRALRDG